MSELDLQQLRQRMGEVAALESDDPERQAVVRRVAEAGPALEREWLALLREQERLRLALFRVDPPAGLHESLRRIPREAPRRRTFRLAVVGSTLAAAAALLLAVSLLIQGPAAPVEPDRFARVADLTLQRHLADPAVSVRSADYQQVEQALADHLPYPTAVPRLGEGFTLIGGGKISLAGKPAVYTRWLHEGKPCSLYQVCASDFDLPTAFGRKVVEPQFAQLESLEQQGYRVMFWSDNQCVYALVAPASDGPPPAMNPAGPTLDFDTPSPPQRRPTPEPEATRSSDQPASVRRL